MVIMKVIREHVRVPVILLAALALIVMAGCKGATDPPFGSTVTVAQFGTTLPITQTGTKTITYKVTVLDEKSMPLNGIDVHLIGSLMSSVGSTTPITMAGATGVAGKPIAATVTTGGNPSNGGGWTLFTITADTGPIIGTLGAAPAGVVLTKMTTTGASLVDGVHTYNVSATNTLGEYIAAPGNTFTTTISNASVSANSIQVSWNTVPLATGYKIYNLERGDVHVISSPTATMWLDMGAPQTTATFPTGNSDSTSGSSNVISGSINAYTGAASTSASVNF